MAVQPLLPAQASGKQLMPYIGQVRGVNVGDWMVPLTAGQGTWRQSGAFRAADWHVVPKNLPKHLAATLSVKCVLLSWSVKQLACCFAWQQHKHHGLL
jgi:NADPH:quinone reductase-like Zn-dependent oxidoreductase